MVSFPGLNLYFNLPQIAITLFNINIYWYAVCIVLGVIVGLIVCKFQEKKFDVNNESVYSMLAISLILGIIGARLYYILFNLDYYTQNPLKILAFRDGGLAIYGGLIVGGISIIIYCKKNKMNLLKTFDFIIPSVVIAQAIGRWGNFFNQEAYGYVTDIFCRMGVYTSNGYIEVHPTFLYESIATFCIFIILIIKSKNIKYDGELLFLYLFLYSAIRMLIEGLRVDSLMFYNFRISQVLSIIIFVISGCILLKNKLNYKKIE